MKTTAQHAEHPPYEPRFYPGEVEVAEVERGTEVRFPGVPVLYPGEVAHVEWDGGETATWVVEPGPGIGNRLRRLRYRLGWRP